jgi:radical SAM protein with 4Fe4S-binding SPASM domain
MVVWNSTRRCNLYCKHCYIAADGKKSKDELTATEARSMIEDLAESKVPMLIISGGEPLVRDDTIELGGYANELGIHVALSSNGTLITRDKAGKLKENGFSYVGISLDGIGDIHDAFRGSPGAFNRAVMGMRNALTQGLKVGVKFTVTKYNFGELPRVIDFAEKKGAHRFTLFQLVYSGRGREIASMDLDHEERRQIIEFIISKAVELRKRGSPLEILTADNYADGVFIYNQLNSENSRKAEYVREFLIESAGGCTAGSRVACIDNSGSVHPCQFWGHLSLGNIRENKFSGIWRGNNNEFLQRLRKKEDHLKGKCGRCKLSYLCGGCRVRAEAVYGDIWQEDPACYLKEEEIRPLCTMSTLPSH